MGQHLVSDEPSAIRLVGLDGVLELARETTGARFAAVGILNERRTELDQFLTSGIDEATHRAIGHVPRGRGVLGELILQPQPLRCADVRQHPNSYGLPPGHPEMRSFLGVPVVIGGRVWGNLYVAEKAEGEFTEADEKATVALAESAATMVSNARIQRHSRGLPVPPPLR
jgi:two-component system, NarL family, sensor histidine kinase DevS